MEIKWRGPQWLCVTRFAACNDHSVTVRENCTGIFRTEVHVTKMNLPGPPEGCPRPGFYTPRVWMNPRRFNFDNIGISVLSLFEVRFLNLHKVTLTITSSKPD